MSLSDEAIALTAQGLPKCGVALLVLAHPEIEDELEAALSDPAVTSAGLARALQARYEGAPKDSTVNRHRRGRCACR